MSTFGQRLRRLREGAKLSQNKLAESLGVSVSTIRMLEKDERKPSMELLTKITSFFYVPADDLLFGEKEVKKVSFSNSESNVEYQEIEELIPAELFRTLDVKKLIDLFLEKVPTIANADADTKFADDLDQGNLTRKFLSKLIALGLIANETLINESIMKLLITALRIDIKTLLNLNDKYLNEKFKIEL